ncbi:MAG: orotidine-5'-phosphate decarboxylase [Chitinophagaceae bacterium]|nr:orotidine-5'-phosphate decarboxylase [Chitinophagaceae bacterium]HMN32002.1 orotidine-5'-phosphate decarboxylase [Chitinophagaceae bacterium]
MDRANLVNQIKEKKSFLCIGLDTDISKIPSFLLKEKDPIFEFNKQIIDSTKDICVSYKINTAFYEANGVDGWQSMQKTIDYIPKNIFTIADAKRGDIGNTSTQYAKAFFQNMNFDSVTVAPYMGKDSVSPFLQFEGKWAIVLGLTSNEGAFDFQYLKQNDVFLFESVIKKVSEWGNEQNLMFVIGATQTEQLQRIRQIIPRHFLLIPGVGTQGGSLQQVCQYGMNEDFGILINVSRQIIYASNQEDFAAKAHEAALKFKKEMEVYF